MHGPATAPRAIPPTRASRPHPAPGHSNPGLQPRSNRLRPEFPPRSDPGRMLQFSGGGGRITPRLQRSALRAAAPRAAFFGAARRRRTSFRSESSPTSGTGRTFLFWWRGEDSNLRRLSRQIYSLIPLTAREPLQKRGGILLQEVSSVNSNTMPELTSRAVRQDRRRPHGQGFD